MWNPGKILRKKPVFSMIIFLTGCYISFAISENISITGQQKSAEKKFYEYYNVELVPVKPVNEFIAYPKKVNIYLSGQKTGELINTPEVYSNKSKVPSDSLIEVKVYGWVWRNSLDTFGKLICPENIRYCANSHIIARLNQGTFLDIIYTNELNSWTLISFPCFIPKKDLITPEEFKNISWIKRFFSDKNVKKPITHRYGGVSVKPATRPLIKFEDLIWQIRLVLSLFFFLLVIYFLMKLYITSEIPDKRKKTIHFFALLSAGIITGGILLEFCLDFNFLI
jgi:hypothetical protein